VPAHEQLAADLALQLGELLAGRRLGDVERLCGVTQAAAGVHMVKDAQPFEVGYHLELLYQQLITISVTDSSGRAI